MRSAGWARPKASFPLKILEELGKLHKSFPLVLQQSIWKEVKMPQIPQGLSASGTAILGKFTKKALNDSMEI